jgi:histidinol-phosphate aminotransferase
LQPGPGQKLVKLNTNENPYPPSPLVLKALREATEGAVRLYPSPDARPLRERVAVTYNVTPEQVICGNGSDEILSILIRTFVDRRDTVAYFEPSYSLYPALVAMSEARVTTMPLPRVRVMRDMGAIPIPRVRAKIFFLTTPNSPYGVAFPTAWVERLLGGFDGIVVADEAYVDFADESTLPLLAANPRLVIVRTLSKTYSLAGMRAGIAMAHPDLIREMMKTKDSYNMGRYAQIAACAALEDQEYCRKNRNAIIATRARFTASLVRIGFTVLPSGANFLFAVPPAGKRASDLYESLLSRGFLVRHFKTPVVSDGLRISIGAEGDMEALARVMEEECRGNQ